MLRPPPRIENIKRRVTSLHQILHPSHYVQLTERIGLLRICPATLALPLPGPQDASTSESRNRADKTALGKPKIVSVPGGS